MTEQKVHQIGQSIDDPAHSSKGVSAQSMQSQDENLERFVTQAMDEHFKSLDILDKVQKLVSKDIKINKR